LPLKNYIIKQEEGEEGEEGKRKREECGVLV
jgi:hypothetical protein